jgi:TonB-dependent SusC/RagA subfamily outer membrane receptor
MPALFIFLIKVNVALLIFCAGYYAVLRHLTFYNLNRVYLVTAIIFSTLYPKVNLSDFLNRHEAIARPIQVVIVNWQAPVAKAAKTFLGHDLWYWLHVVFWTGVIAFAIRLSLQLLSLYRLHQRSEPATVKQYMVRVIHGDINPFSFWRNIYINPANHPPHELDAILEHEQVHVKEWHTLDILLAEVSTIFYWFNPGVWLMKRAIRENIEFITDQKILQKGIDCKAYQYSLLSVNFGSQNNPIVNNFNISTIKKRIMMMNAKRSSNFNITRYLFLIPAVMALLLVFSVSKAELNKAAKSSYHMIKILKSEITKINFTGGKPSNNNHGETALLSAVSMFKIQADTDKHLKILMDTVRYTPDKSEEKKIFYSFSIGSDSGRKENKTLRYSLKMDTGRKQGVVITATGDSKEGKPEIYINGVKTDVDLTAIDPNNIATINIKKDSNISPNGIIYIVTKGHELTTVKGNILYADTIINGVKAKVDHVYGLTTTASGSNTLTLTSKIRPTSARINGKNMDVKNLFITKTVVNGDTIYITNVPVAARSLKLGKADSVRYSTLTGNAATLKTIMLNGNRMPQQAITIKPAPIRFSDKLIVIDGKEATQKQMKKISADKIDSISTLNGDAATAVYGDKGKNGVVVITTKK